MNTLLNISPIDGRYKSRTKTLEPFFSEFGLIKYRVFVEVEYLLALTTLKGGPLSGLNKDEIARIKSISDDFSVADAGKIKEIERTTNHDVKAVEYFIKGRLEKCDLGSLAEWVHFGLTSQDVNNTAVPVSIKGAVQDVILPALRHLKSTLDNLAIDFSEIAMLARTHGQPASPTRLGKEIGVFCERLQKQLDQLEGYQYEGKFGGATGNFNAHYVAYPDVDWVQFGNSFLQSHLGLTRQQTTTQIAHYDDLAALFHIFIRLNTILIDFARDIWTYISMEYFKQKVVAGEVGSSTMPHKVNPIDFENAEGNLGVANALFDHLAMKLPVSRLQRDLTDSTVLRNVGVPMAHTLLALASLEKGIGKLLVNKAQIEHDLDQHWAVVGEAIQTILRRESYPKPYEALKSLTRGKARVTRKDVHEFIDGLEISDALKAEMKAITPANYTGIPTHT